MNGVITYCLVGFVTQIIDKMSSALSTHLKNILKPARRKS